MSEIYLELIGLPGTALQEAVIVGDASQRQEIGLDDPAGWVFVGLGVLAVGALTWFEARSNHHKNKD